MEVGVSFQRMRLGGGGARVLVGSCVPGTERGSLYGTCHNVRAARSRVGCCAACLVGGAYARAFCLDGLRYSLDRSPGEPLVLCPEQSVRVRPAQPDFGGHRVSAFVRLLS